MNSNEFWTMWSALATTGGAIATFGAVVVALWQSHLQYRKHLEIKLNFAQTVPDLQQYFSVTVSNRGNGEVTINRFSWLYMDKSTALIPFQQCNCITNGQYISLPYTLPQNSSIDILCPINYVKSALQYAIQEKRITTDDKIKVFVVDSQGDRYYAKSKLDVNIVLKNC